MSDLIIGAAAIPRCGNCHFAATIQEDLQAIECRGAPPTPAIMGMGPNGPAVGLLRARLPRAESGCALWKLKREVQAPVP